MVETGVGGIIEKVQYSVEPDVVFPDRKALLAGNHSSDKYWIAIRTRALLGGVACLLRFLLLNIFR